MVFFIIFTIIGVKHNKEHNTGFYTYNMLYKNVTVFLIL